MVLKWSCFVHFFVFVFFFFVFAATMDSAPAMMTCSSLTVSQEFGPEGDGGGGGTQVVHGRSRMTIDPRIPTMAGWSTPGFTN